MTLENSIIIALQEDEYNHRSQTTHCHIQKRGSYIITEATANPTKNKSIQVMDHIHAWTRPIHGRLAEKNNTHASKYQCNTINH